MENLVISEFIYADVQKKNSCTFLHKKNAEDVEHFIKTLDEYTKTSLVDLKELASKFGVKKIYVKDESQRLGLNAFKGIGVLYGVVRVICQKLDLSIDSLKFDDLLRPDLNNKIKKFIFVAATDGNHGKGLAWVSNKLGCACHIYMPKNTTSARVEAIEKLGATVTVTDGNYDETLRLVIDKASENKWVHIQDQAWEGYTETTNLISEGYTIIAKEILDQMKEYGEPKPTHIILQAGAGTFALGIMGYMANIFSDNKPYMTIAEPENAACYFESIKNKKYSTVSGDLETVMAGLSVGEANIVAWDILSAIVDNYAKCSDNITARGMRILSSPLGQDKRVVSGESGALGMGLLSILCQSDRFTEHKNKMGIDENSVVLLINTEGDTDPVVYKNIVWNGNLESNL